MDALTNDCTEEGLSVGVGKREKGEGVRGSLNDKEAKRV